ncbi:MAG: AsnC family transcriptional regulator [Zestosphaera tikiterensis]|uniref:AsnC family transcriptional regulator n=1 Tax=Zestosphaera tikiterensis TaxID=1973259 RepID=A0A2R7Y4N8_9CREN|nr:MAG: AsnC family transcriptional regulator [Zestosphaera tikiterensis]
MKERIDEIDMKLIKLLKENARMKYSSLALELGISESAVRKRLRKLVSLGIIKKFTIEYVVPNEVRAAILIKTSPLKPVPEVSKEIVKIEGVDTVYEVTGDNDILVIVKAPSIDAINKCIDKIRAIPGVASTNTLIILRSWS